MVVASAVLGAFVYLQIQISQSSVSLSRVESTATAEDTRIESIRTRVAELGSPGRIVAEAKRLGLVAPPVVEFLRIRER
jgi:cell division protein FtsL